MTSAEALTPGDHWRSLAHDGRERKFLVHVPSSAPPEAGWPVVLAFHGATSNARLMQHFSGLDAKADEAGFVVVYPAGTGNLPNVLTWNGGSCCGYAKNHNVDDVGFVLAMLDDLARSLPCDSARIFLAGMSNGAHMAYRLAAEASDRFAAVAGVAGPLAIDDPRPSRPIPVLHIHGTLDEFAPFDGGIGARSVYGVPFRSVPETVAIWVRLNDCEPNPTTAEITDSAADGTHVTIRTYPARRGDAEVVWVTVHGGGHTWPGRPPLPALLGRSTSNLDANALLWDFFARHGRKV